MLEPFYLPKDLTRVVAAYAAESSFIPLEFDCTRSLAKNEHNRTVFNDIEAIFKSREPGFERLQNDLIEHHSRHLLRQVFKAGLHTSDRLEVFRKIANHDPAAAKQRRDELRMMMNFFPYSELENQFDLECEGRHWVVDKHQQTEEVRYLSLQYWCDALKNFDPRFEKEGSRLKRLARKSAHVWVTQAEKEFNADHIPKAIESGLKALQSFCRLNQKREAISIVTRLIQWCSLEQSDNTVHILTLFSFTKPLCLKYPQDWDLYANLLFAVNDHCYDRAEYAKLKEINLQAELDGLGRHLTYIGTAQFHYEQIRADLCVHTERLTVMQKINAAIEYCISVFDRMEYDRGSAIKYFCCFARIYGSAAKLAWIQSVHFEEMSTEQREQACYLVKFDQALDPLLRNVQNGRFPSLMHQRPAGHAVSRERLVSGATAYYKNALKALMDPIVSFNQSDEAKGLFVIIFGELVDFYGRSNDVKGLALLLLKKNIKGFMKFDNFEEQLPAWRKVLSETRKRGGRIQLNK